MGGLYVLLEEPQLKQRLQCLRLWNEGRSEHRRK